MNREEILNMPAGNELDALIEQKIFERGLSNNGLASYIKMPNGYSDLRENKKYSTDITDAFCVIKQFSELGLLWQIQNHERGTDNQYCCFVYVGEVVHRSYNASLPLAICRAALLVVIDNERKNAKEL